MHGSKQTGRGRAARIAVTLALALGLAGCGASALESVTGAIPVGNPFASKPKGEALPVQMFIASTRPDPKASIRRGSVEGAAHFSLATVSVPPNHRAGAIEQPTFGRASPDSDFVLQAERPLGADEFRNAVATNLSGRVGSNRDVLVFIHGYNTSAGEARFRLAQIVADGQFGGVPVLFTWPTRGEIAGYVSDKDSATASRDALTKLFLDLAQTPDIGRVHVLAHSMGAWLAMEGLREAALGGHAGLDGKLGEVMLAAPDIDLAVFRQQMQRIGKANVSVFVSTSDRALSLSSLIARDRPRVGAMNPRNDADRNALKRLGVTIYDVSGASGGLVGHDVYADAPQVIRLIGSELGQPRADDANVSSVLGSRDDARPAGPEIQSQPLEAPAQ